MSVTVTWAQSSDQTIASYLLESAPTATGSWSAVATVSASDPAYLDSALGIYEYPDLSGSFVTWYRVTANDIYGQSSPASPAFQPSGLDQPLATIDDLKLYLSKNGTAEDALLQTHVDQASAWFRSQVGWNITLELQDETRSGDGYDALALRHQPVQEVVSVSIDGAAQTAATGSTDDGWFLADGCACLRGTGLEFTEGKGNVRVIYTSGYPVVPADVKGAVVEMAALFYKGRERVGTLSKNLGNEMVTFQTLSVPITVSTVVDRYRRLPF